MQKFTTRTLINLIDTVSIAAVRTLFSRGKDPALGVLVATLQAARNPGRVNEMAYLDIVRGFAVDEDLRLNGNSWYDGATLPQERVLIALLARYFRPRVVVEVGTYRGTTTRLLLDNTGEGTRVITIDLPPDRDAWAQEETVDNRFVRKFVAGSDYRDHPDAGRVTQVLGNSFDPATWANVPAGVDLAFIDAAHTYEAVRNDTEKALEKLAPEGVIIWHDYMLDEEPGFGVGRYVRELMAERDDVFVCPGTMLAFRVPMKEIARARKKAATFVIGK